jgi:protein-S-isoprenylcysteine O-methyltransferase Ste14
MRLQLRVPPVAVLLITALLMAVTAWPVPALAFLRLPYQALVACGVALVGAAMSILGVLSFRRAGTTVNPLKPDTSSALVRSGVYKLTRNPMYLGFLMLLIGWSIYLSNAVALIFVPMFLMYMNRFQIEPEERALTSRFGQEFIEYTTRVRRWL